MTDLRQQLAGSWSLVDFRRLREGVFRRYPMGEKARGRIIYSELGTMCAFLMTEDWAERRPTNGVGQFLSYSGRWRLEGDAVIHAVDAASDQQYIGQDMVRIMHWKDGQLTLQTEDHIGADGARSQNWLTWKRES